MARNKKLELKNVGSGRWLTTDGRFGIMKRPSSMRTDWPMDKWKIEHEYSIHMMDDTGVPPQFFELAPEVGRVKAQKDIFPWLGQFTGEGSFEIGNPGKVVAKVPGVMSGKRKEMKGEILNLLMMRDELL